MSYIRVLKGIEMKYVIVIVIVFAFLSHAYPEEVNTHYIDYPLQYYIYNFEVLKVVDINQPMPLLETFPLDELRKNEKVVDLDWYDSDTLLITLMLDDKIQEAVRCDYYIHTTREDVELRMASLLINRTLMTYNSLDIGRYGEIGDNSWYSPDSTVVDFTRNNVVVHTFALTPEFNPEAVYTCAQIVDELITVHLVPHDKAHIPAPVINSAEYEPYENSNNRVLIHVDAYDPGGQALTYTYLGLGAAVSYDVGEFRFNLLAWDPPICHVWVMNEDRIFSSVRLNFTSPSTVDDEDDAVETPAAFTLSQNWPNPFNPATAIPFTLREDGYILLTVYDLLGREVAVLADGDMSAGTHELTWDGRTQEGMSCGSGVYLYRLVTPHGSESRSMMLVR